MLSVLQHLKLGGFLNSKKTRIDFAIFRLHYQFTVVLLLVFSVIVTTKQYAGDPMKCTRDSKAYSAVADAFCYITTTFTSKSAYDPKLKKEIPYPGIRQTVNKDDYRYHRYYQWVGFVLFSQAVLFYFPHWLWKMLEGNRASWLLSGIDFQGPDVDEVSKKRDKVLDYLSKSWGYSNMYALKYFFCEFLCLFNVLIQMYALDRMFDGDFMWYGMNVAKYLKNFSEDLVDPMMKVFPRVASCTFRYFGETGKLNKVHLICILSVNVINEKIFVFLWFWLMGLALASCLAGVLRLFTYVVPWIRKMMLKARFRHVHSENVKVLMECSGLGDWFLLQIIAQNVDDVDFVDFVTDLSKRLSVVKSTSV